MTLRWVLLCVSLASAARAETLEVVSNGGLVSVNAANVPLSVVVDRLAAKTDMAVTYDGPRPSDRITVALAGRRPLDAVHELLRGRGLNYMWTAERAGGRVEKLVIVSSARHAPPSTTPASPEPEPSPADASLQPASDAPVRVGTEDSAPPSTAARSSDVAVSQWVLPPPPSRPAHTDASWGTPAQAGVMETGAAPKR